MLHSLIIREYTKYSERIIAVGPNCTQSLYSSAVNIDFIGWGEGGELDAGSVGGGGR